MQRVIKVWYTHTLRWYLLPLLIVSGGYRAVMCIRRWLYRFGVKSVTKFPVPVIVVGNLTVGGTGKTPLVIWLVNELKARGYHPGVVSRGYGGAALRLPLIVDATSYPQEAGDEAVLLSRRTQCPVVVGPDRVKAVQLLLQEFYCNIVVSDDGLQHLALGRDVEIAVVDGRRKLGNNCCLPVGPLREPKYRLNQVDFVVANGGGIREAIPMEFCPGSLYSVKDKQSCVVPKGSIHAVAAIGHPEQFFASLVRLGFTLTTHVFRDHYFYQAQDFAFLQPNEVVVMTEKDAVKCEQFADGRFFYLSVDAQLPDAFVFDMVRRL